MSGGSQAGGGDFSFKLDLPMPEMPGAGGKKSDAGATKLQNLALPAVGAIGAGAFAAAQAIKAYQDG